MRPGLPAYCRHAKPYWENCDMCNENEDLGEIEDLEEMEKSVSSVYSREAA